MAWVWAIFREVKKTHNKLVLKLLIPLKGNENSINCIPLQFSKEQ
jgi:hypothetical protein